MPNKEFLEECPLYKTIKVNRVGVTLNEEALFQSLLQALGFRHDLPYRLECSARHVAQNAMTALFHNDLPAAR